MNYQKQKYKEEIRTDKTIIPNNSRIVSSDQNTFLTYQNVEIANIYLSEKTKKIFLQVKNHFSIPHQLNMCAFVVSGFEAEFILLVAPADGEFAAVGVPFG